MKKAGTLTTKQKAFADKLIAEPKKSATAVALEVYGKPDRPTTHNTAAQIATANMRNSTILMYLNKHQSLAEETIIDVLQTSGSKRDNSRHAEIALKAADMVLDRTIGKPTTNNNTHLVGAIQITLGRPVVVDV